MKIKITNIYEIKLGQYYWSKGQATNPYVVLHNPSSNKYMIYQIENDPNQAKLLASFNNTDTDLANLAKTLLYYGVDLEYQVNNVACQVNNITYQIDKE